MKLAIIGAGLAGLAAARRLRALLPELEITIYEKSRGLGGRAATRRRDGFVFDHGAQYLKAPTRELLRLIQGELASDDLFDIGKPVWVFDRHGTVGEGDPEQNADPKWCYRRGLNTLGKLLGDGLDVWRETRVMALRREPRDSSWTLVDDRGTLVGAAELVLLTPPAPQTAEILAMSDLPPSVGQTLRDALQPAIYRRCLSFALAYARLMPRPFYALVNTDRGHPISWLALEHDKGPQRCPPSHSLIIAQMAPSFSLEHWETPLDQVTPMIAGLVGSLLCEDLDEPLWCDRQGWRYALPDGPADPTRLDRPELGLFFAGDYTAGQGRMHLAIEQGWRAATVIAARANLIGS